MKYWTAYFFVVASSFGLLAGDALPLNLGNGEPGLFIIYASTNEYVVFINEAIEKSWKPGGESPEWWSSCNEGPVKVIAGQNFGPENFSSHFMENWFAYMPNANIYDLFPFDEHTVFTSDGDPQNRKGWLPRETQVFSIYADGILVSHDVDALARARYGLRTNQWFLGKIGTNIYYWETRKPNIVYYRSAEEKQAAYYFKLPKADFEIWGVKKAITPSKDVGFSVDRTLGPFEYWGDFWRPNAQPSFIEFTLKDAKRVKSTK